MGRNCRLELRLVPENKHESRIKEEQEEKLAIFFDELSVCDVAQLQARAIITLESKEMEEKMKSIIGSEPSLPSSPLPKSSAFTVTKYNNTGLSMKRSLQRFLQKRKIRNQSTAPYDLYSKKY